MLKFYIYTCAKWIGTTRSALGIEDYFGALLLSRSLSDLKNRSENLAGRGQILLVSQVNSCSIDQESGEICAV